MKSSLFPPSVYLLLAGIVLLLCSPAASCECSTPQTIQDNFYSNFTTNFVRALVVNIPKSPPRAFRLNIVLRIQTNYKGCLRRRRVVVITNKSSCFVRLFKGVSYVLPLSGGRMPEVINCNVSPSVQTVYVCLPV